MVEKKWKRVISKKASILRNDWLMNVCQKDIMALLGKRLNHLIVRKGERYTHYPNIESMDQLALILYKRIMKDTHHIDKLIEQAEKLSKEFIDLTKNLEKEDLSEKSNEELLRFYKKYCELHEKFIVYDFVTHFFELLQRDVKDFLKLKLSEKNKLEKLEEYLTSLVSAEQQNAAALEEKELLKIVIEIEQNPELVKLFTLDIEKIEQELKNHPNINDKIVTHANKYFWLFEKETGEPWTKKDFINLISQNLKEENLKQRLNHLEEYSDKVKQRRQEIIKELNPPEEIIRIIDSLQKSGWLRTFVRNGYVQAFIYSKNLFETIREHMRLTKHEFMFVRHQEVLDFLEKEKSVDTEKIKEREGDVVLILEDEKPLKFLIGEEARTVRDEKLGLEEEIKESVLKGTPASVGSVKGYVKIIHSLKDANKIEQGDILVTMMTTPDLVFVMRKSSAIITDEGGILCHAAIVSRELGVPCITGTEKATKVLKDGDFIEVDAHNGIVKILKRV